MTETAAPPLAPPVAAALADPPAPELGTVEANGLAYGVRAWGNRDRPPVLLIHGVTASSAIWWRVGPALAVALDARIVAIDQAGHGRTAGWLGHHRFADNAADLVGFARAAGLAVPGLRIVGHSWGGMTAAAMPGAGLVPDVLVLLDPPALPLAAIASRLDDPVERRYATLDEAVARLGPAHPTWPWGDVLAKAEALTQLDEQAVIDVLTGNGDWDCGLAALDDPAAAHVPVRYVRADPAFGGLMLDAFVPALEARVGPANLINLPGTAHAPMRLHPEATTLALVRALAADGALAGDGPLATGQPGGADARRRQVDAEPDAAPRGVTGRVASVLGDAAEHVETAALAVGAAVGRTIRRIEERPGARVRRVRRLGHHPLPYLDDVHPDARQRTARALGIRTIDVAEIAGTAVGGAQQRGGDFLPLKPFRGGNWHGRWQRLGRASDALAVLPPIDATRYDDRYWVSDGHNRVAMALYTGQQSIDADVTDLVDSSAARDEPGESFASIAEDSRELRAAVSRVAPRPRYRDRDRDRDRSR